MNRADRRKWKKKYKKEPVMLSMMPNDSGKPYLNPNKKHKYEI